MPTSASRRVWEGKAGDYTPDGLHCLVLMWRNHFYRYTKAHHPRERGDPTHVAKVVHAGGLGSHAMCHRLRAEDGLRRM